MKRRRREYFIGKEVCSKSGGSGENGSNEDTHITHLNGEMEEVQDLVEEVGRGHQTRISSTANNTTQRIPGTIIHPI